MKKFDQINVIPFIDIMLVLLAIVLMTASFISQGKIKVSVPEAETATAVSAEDISGHYITVTEDGIYYLNDLSTDIESLDSNMASWSSTVPVTLKIDARSAFEEFIKISDLLRKHELSNVQVITLPKAN